MSDQGTIQDDAKGADGLGQTTRVEEMDFGGHSLQ